MALARRGIVAAFDFTVNIVHFLVHRLFHTSMHKVVHHFEFLVSPRGLSDLPLVMEGIDGIF